jgi:(p)ppGpp synthase/HD superfamily hydrolase
MISLIRIFCLTFACVLLQQTLSFLAVKHHSFSSGNLATKRSDRLPLLPLYFKGSSVKVPSKKIYSNINETQYLFDESSQIDTLWYLLSSEKKLDEEQKFSADVSSGWNHLPSVSMHHLIGDAPSFQELSNNIKSIPKEVKPAWLPGLNAWRAVIDQADIVNVEEKDLAPPSLTSYFQGNSKLSAKHSAHVAGLWANLKKRKTLKNIDENNEKLIIEALRVAYIGLWGKKTQRSMEVSINRAAGTAGVLAEFQGDDGSLDVMLAGILHEVLYETSSDCYEQVKAGITERFGAHVLNITERYLALPKFKALKAEYTPMQSEHMIQMLVASCDCYPVLYIRLADRLHTMRFIRHLPLNETERVKIAQEAINVYAPLAHKMTLLKVKEELEDLAFRVIHPEMYVKYKNTQIRAFKAASDLHSIIRDQILSDPVVQAQGKAEVYFRVKSKYQMYLKMERKNITNFNDLKDAIGLRVIFHPKRLANQTSVSSSSSAEVEYSNILPTSNRRVTYESADEMEQRGVDICYHLVERLKNLPGWKPDEKGIKDYIKEKKPTGYQSIHQFLYNEGLNVAVEVQIRTKTMHYNAEIGEAAHWYYKDLIYRAEVANSKSYRLAWRSENQMKANSAAAILGLAHQQLLNSRVFVFLNDHATVVSFDKGSTVLDVAFYVHSKLGLSTSFVTVGGRPVELSRPLKNGDVISVQKTVDGEVAAKPYWLQLVKSKAATTALNRFFRNSQRSSNVVMGLVQFIMVMTFNIDLLISWCHGIPDAKDLSRMIRSHTTYADLSHLLADLNGASKEKVSQIMGDLFDIPADVLTVCNMATALQWAKLQGSNGWADKRMQSLVLLPLLNELLPSLGVQNAAQHWSDLIGSKSLTNEQSPYLKALSAHLKAPSKLSSSSNGASNLSWLKKPFQAGSLSSQSAAAVRGARPHAMILSQSIHIKSEPSLMNHNHNQHANDEVSTSVGV